MAIATMKGVVKNLVAAASHTQIHLKDLSTTPPLPPGSPDEKVAFLHVLHPNYSSVFALALASMANGVFVEIQIGTAAEVLPAEVAGTVAENIGAGYKNQIAGYLIYPPF